MPHIQNFFTVFEPGSVNVKATLLILHGMQEHSGRYTMFAKYLSNNGIVVITYDHRGHGRTVSDKKDLGFFDLENPLEKLIQDAKILADYLQSLYPFVPHFVMGHSMGSFITRCLLQEASAQFKGAIIMGTGGKISGLKLAHTFISGLNKIAPRHRSRLINGTFGWHNNLRFKKESPQDGTNWLSANIDNRKAFLEDPLCGVDFTNNGFYTLFSAVLRATDKDWAKNIATNFPILFISGADDPIGNFSKGVKKTVNDLQQQDFKNVSIKLYAAMRHEILNEDIKDEVYDAVANWINSNI